MTPALGSALSHPEDRNSNLSEPRGYFLGLSTVTDLERLEQFQAVTNRLGVIYEGRPLVESEPVAAVLGPPTEARLTLVEFATMGHLRRMSQDPEFVRLVEKFQGLAPGPACGARGVMPPPPQRAPTTEPPAYAVSRFELPDPARLEKFRVLIERLVFSHGGRFLVRIQPVETLWGPPDARYLTIAEFGSMQRLQAAANSADFHDMEKLSIGQSNRNIWIARGRPPGAPD